jgi:cold shock CspA family protein
MGRSQETFNKKEVRKKQEKRRKDKELKRAKKKSEGGKSTFDNMIAYVDEFGKISSTPPDPGRITVIDPTTIELKITANSPETESNYKRKGVVTAFFESKGYGFIRDLVSSQSVFVHRDNLLEPVHENNVVSYEIGRGPKGPTALKVELFKE